ncbi:hypothetical protein RCO27_19000 [Sphingosinicella sp. LHD-64]|uniref:hypothetical protein n=1 Tax=Sphingosinicella sp. LHD-64 TaxID=3072139 RepID=UPI002810308F|nr:hypothetical protein [Sphingosinicella sp. LHD-64]MDQ8758322.1 hypothetical protein [Sphingosinicella sp. LHD-64]
MGERGTSPAKAARNVIQRLLQMRQLWEDASNHYFDPDRFQLALQNCITTSRTVTFILQSNKAAMTGFDEWYAEHVKRWSADPIMSWARDARNSIEKRGDLETYSQVRATIIASYVGNPESAWLKQSLFATPQHIYRGVPKKYMVPHVIENGTLLIERRWVDSALPDMEILEALAHVYGQLADTIIDYIKCNRLPAPPELGKTRPTAMQALAMDRAIYLSMMDGSVRGFRYYKRPLKLPDKQTRKKVLERYGGAQWKGLHEARTFKEIAGIYFKNARAILKRDGHHRNFMFFLEGEKIIQMIPYDHPDRASRYVLMHDLSKLAKISGADGMMMIGEAWTAEASRLPPSGFAVDADERGEALVMHCANAEGASFSYHADFQRKRPGSKKVKSIGETIYMEDEAAFIVLPFLREWGVLDMDKVAAAANRMSEAGIRSPMDDPRSP